MKTKLLMAVAMMAAATASLGQKVLTLEDVMYSGNNFFNLAPENLYTQWWGDTPLKTTPDEVVDLNTGQTLVTAEALNAIAGEKAVRNAHSLSFPANTRPPKAAKGS